jgi:hypothetical protein
MGVMVVLTSLSIVVAATTTWAHRTVFKTDAWLSVVGPLPRDPAVAQSIASFAMDEIATVTDLRARILEALPDQLDPLVDTVLTTLRTRVQARIVTFIEGDTFNRVWVEVNRRAHDAIVRILRGESNILQTNANGEVRLNLVPLVYSGLSFLQEHASFALRGHVVPIGVDPVGDPEAAVQALATEFGRPLDTDFAQPVVFQSDSLHAAQQAVHLFDVAFWVALFLPLVLIALTLLLSRNRRRQTVQLAIGALFALLLAQAAIRRLQEQVVNSVGERNRGAVGHTVASAVHGLEVLIVVCLIVAVLVAIAMYLLGRPAWFMRTLAAGHRLLETDRSKRIQTYVAQRASEFAWGGVGVGVIVLWIVGISWVSLAVVAVLLIAWLALIQSLRRRSPAAGSGPTAPTQEAAGHPA